MSDKKHTPGQHWRAEKNGPAYNIHEEGYIKHQFILVNMVYVSDETFAKRVRLCTAAPIGYELAEMVVELGESPWSEDIGILKVKARKFLRVARGEGEPDER